MATRGTTRQRARGATRTRRARGRTIFFPPRHPGLAKIISIESPSAFRASIRKLKKMGIGAREKRALVLAQNRARAMLKRRNLSEKERRQLQAIVNTPLPPVTKPARRAA
jgi:hypothetical protein